MKRILVVLGLALVALLVLPPLWFSLFPGAPPLELPLAGKRVELAPGRSVNVLDAGEGPPIVLVHGMPGSAYDWEPTRSALLGAGFRVIAYDRMGYGHSDAREPGDVRVDDNARELLALLEGLDVQDATLVGWSYGGGTSLVAARLDPSRIRGLVLVGSVGPGIEARGAPPVWLIDFINGPVLSWISAVPPVAQRVRETMVRTAFAPEPVSPGYSALSDANLEAPNTLDTLRREGRDLEGRVDLDPSALALPILVIQGDGDQLVPLVVAENLHARARDSELRVVPSGGHMLPVTRGPWLAERIANFSQAP
ncbi:alpha/beta hydrolase [Myxococcota bacterium]|nr:alpha/beta hydrolase [Myxococcota bacterium]